MERLLYQDQQLRIVVLAAPPDPAVSLCGEVDITNSPALARALALWRDGCPHLTVDTAALTFVDLSGIRVLALPALPPAERWIRLRNVTPCQRRMLELMGWFDGSHPVAVP
ncbi:MULTISPECIES: STAS domain-containing protein [unclassified Nonomuraea]|uniref:STAS domain-containing protein n=1 Tax=Nonomuraea sp. NPDC049725 TaxID=3154508 RepID=UPI00342C1520